MSEIENQVQDTQIQSNDVAAQQNSGINPEQNKEENTDPNWRAFREARKREREEMEAAKRIAAEKEKEVKALKEAMEAAFSKSAPTPQAYQHYYGIEQKEETQEEIIERKLNELLLKKQEQLERAQAERERMELPNRLKRDFPDFTQVCSQENLDYLDYHYPELSRPLQRLQDGYEKWSDIYHAVKKFIPNYQNIKKDAQKADVNLQKPKSISVTGSTPSGTQVKETYLQIEQRRAENWERMQRTLKGIG